MGSRKWPLRVAGGVAFLAAIVVTAVVAYLAGQVSVYGRRDTGPLLNRGRRSRPLAVPSFTAREKQRRRYCFSYDTPQTLAALRREEKLDAQIAGCRDDFDAACRLLAWTRRQWEPGRPDPYPPIDAREILKRIRAGRTGGFCAQYCYVFVQAMQSLGFRARYMTLVDHEVCEVYLPSRRRWACFDPLYEATYADASGFPLSVGRISGLVRTGGRVEMKTARLPADVTAHLKKFEYFAVWIKNDHVAGPINFDSLERYKVYLVNSPEDIRRVPSTANYSSFHEDFYENCWFPGEGGEVDP